MPDVYFGLTFDDGVHPLPDSTQLHTFHLGPKRLLQLLEQHLGLAGYEEEVDHLRTEQYRQAIVQHERLHAKAFYQTAFAADEFATAADLLARRDELYVLGWDFSADVNLPERLACLAEIEGLLVEQATLQLYPGDAERVRAVIEALAVREQPIERIYVNEPLNLLPPTWKILLAALRQNKVTVEPIAEPHLAKAKTDLQHFQQQIAGAAFTKRSLKGDGSLLLLRGRRETHLAAYLAALLRENGNCPTLLIPGKNRTLDNALLMEGLPSVGTPSTSLARPTLQVLKLVTCFLWEPIDIYKVMEFVSLGTKPLDDQLANRLAQVLAARPGLQSEAWYATVARFFDELAALPVRDKNRQPEQLRQQYNFWFQRERYDRSGVAPKDSISELFVYLQRWARREFEDTGEENTSLLVLSEQARRIVELLEALPENALTPLQLERIVRTIYEPAPAHFREAEQGCLSAIYQPASLLGGTDELIWWDFVNTEPDYFFSRWYADELTYLAAAGLEPETPSVQNQRRVWQRKRPVLHCRQRLILCLPNFVNGAAAHPHPLFGDLEATFSDLSPITLDVDAPASVQSWTTTFVLPSRLRIDHQQLGAPQAFLHVDRPAELEPREQESFSGLQSLFYYPYQYVFRHKVKLRKSSILSVVKDRTLMGNLAHRFIEEILPTAEPHWTRQDIDAAVDRLAPDLLRREGATLLAYGREPTRINFLNRVKHATAVLLSHIHENNWRVDRAEYDLHGSFEGVGVNGRADLVLRRDGGEAAIVDLKWSSGRFYENRMRNGEDLQLVLYSELLRSGERLPDVPHTAYYIISKGDLIARNQRAFRQCRTVDTADTAEGLHRSIYEKMRATFLWRIQQMQRGEVEIRCTQTTDELEETYGNQLMDLLEMQEGDAPFDDYRTLINLVE